MNYLAKRAVSNAAVFNQESNASLKTSIAVLWVYCSTGSTRGFDGHDGHDNTPLVFAITRWMFVVQKASDVHLDLSFSSHAGYRHARAVRHASCRITELLEGSLNVLSFAREHAIAAKTFLWHGDSRARVTQPGGGGAVTYFCWKSTGASRELCGSMTAIVCFFLSLNQTCWIR